MRESRTSGSGRGDQGNPVPYRHRIFTVPADSGEGPLTEPTAAAQPWRRERVLMPHSCRLVTDAELDLPSERLLGALFRP